MRWNWKFRLFVLLSMCQYKNQIQMINSRWISVDSYTFQLADNNYLHKNCVQWYMSFWSNDFLQNSRILIIIDYLMQLTCYWYYQSSFIKNAEWSCSFTLAISSYAWSFFLKIHSTTLIFNKITRHIIQLVFRKFSFSFYCQKFYRFDFLFD